MTFENLLVDIDGPLALITLNRPSVLNALNAHTLDELRRVVLDVKRSDTLRAVIITGAGEKAFAAGADVGELAALHPADAQQYAMRGQHVFDVIESLGKPVIAAINGYALGGGCELAMACTLRVAADTARFGQPEINLGLTPGFAATQRLPRLVGKGAALELLLTGRQIPAAEALALGLVNRVVPAAELMSEARRLAGELSAKPPLAMRHILDAVHRGSELPLDRGQYLEATLFGLAAASDDMHEGVAAFLEKRSATFRGR